MLQHSHRDSHRGQWCHSLVREQSGTGRPEGKRQGHSGQVEQEVILGHHSDVQGELWGKARNRAVGVRRGTEAAALGSLGEGVA